MYYVCPICIGTYKNNPIRPVVKIHFNSNFEQLAYPYELDISKTEQNIRIIKILEKEDLTKLSKHRS